VRETDYRSAGRALPSHSAGNTHGMDYSLTLLGVVVWALALLLVLFIGRGR
jgi:hypothetical protein